MVNGRRFEDEEDTIPLPELSIQDEQLSDEG